MRSTAGTTRARLDPGRVRVEVGAAKVAITLLLVAGATVLGFWALWPYLYLECRRLEPARIAVIFLGDALALAWFVRLAFNHAIPGRAHFRPLRPSTKFGWALLLSAAAGLAVDLGFTLHQMNVEQDQYRNAQPAVAEVLDARRGEMPARTRYHFTVQFRDAEGVLRRTELETWRSMKKGWLHGTSSELIAQLQSGGVDRLPIRYDRAWPLRAWIEGVGPNDDSLAWFSLVVIVFQAISLLAGTVNFAFALQKQALKGRVPWWHDMHEAIPMSMEAGLMIFAGLVSRGWEWTTLAGVPWSP